MADTGNNNENNSKVDWARLIVFLGVIVCAIIIVFIVIAFFAILHERPGATLSLILLAVCLLGFSAIVWGALWIVSGKREVSIATQGVSTTDTRIDELIRENERLKQQLAELSSEHKGK